VADVPGFVAVPKDRSRALRLFGGILIASGILCAGLSFLVLVSRFLAPGERQKPFVVYVALAAALITLGIGTIRGRRWARHLTLIGSAASLAGALLGAPFTLWLVSRFVATEPRLSSHGATVRFAVLLPVVGVLLLLTLLPLAFLLFYRRRDVRETVERLDPDPGWTDRQPLPLIAAAVFFATSALGWLTALSRPVIPAPGAILTGNTARALVLGIAVAGAAIAWGLYRGMRGAWLAAVVLSVAAAVLWLWTIRDLDFEALQRAMGASDEEVAITRRFDLRPGLFVLTAVGAAAWTGYLVWIRRYLKRDPLVSR